MLECYDICFTFCLIGFDTARVNSMTVQGLEVLAVTKCSWILLDNQSLHCRVKPYDQSTSVLDRGTDSVQNICFYSAVTCVTEVFHIVTTCSHVGGYQHIGGMCIIHVLLPPMWLWCHNFKDHNPGIFMSASQDEFI